MQARLFIYVVFFAFFVVTTDFTRASELLNRNSEASRLVLNGDLNSARIELERRYKNELDPYKKYWLAFESYIIPSFSDDIEKLVEGYRTQSGL